MRGAGVTDCLRYTAVACWIFIIIKIYSTDLGDQKRQQNRQQNRLQNRLQNLMIINWPPVNNNITCHNSLTEDALPSVEDPSFSPKSKSIFFHETSCRGGIDSRQACAVESAARAHPDWDVHLLFNSPVSKTILYRSCLTMLRQYPNVKVARVLAYNFSKRRIVRSVVRKIMKNSLHPVEHTADVMKMVTLNKWGGVYLDLDELVINPFYPLPPNWIAKETDDELSSGAMAFSNDQVGKNITNAVIEEIFMSYNPTKWSYNGALAIQRVLHRKCEEIIKNKNYCNGVKIFGKEMFYPINYSWVHLYFKPNYFSIGSLEKPYTIHLWNALTKIYDVPKTSPYSTLAKKYCPMIYEMYGNSFGV